ncbi:multicopper oxidase family protein [Planctomonas deserti]|uniref:multicopper oxidase family protein n=1 Tax=Planctomonas deserti TaxID=2144185 RepID=UPI000D3CFC99|nr:multicopper oxidase family protein [Planctomonas deserti]
MTITRRTALQVGGIGAIGAAALTVPLTQAQASTPSTLATANFPKRFATPLPIPKELPRSTSPDAEASPYYEISELAAEADIVPGLKTTVLGYNGVFPGPTIVADKGEPIRVKVRNKLPLLHPTWGHALHTSTHLHGSASLPQYDGYASDLTAKDQSKTYRYPNSQPARTLWYHDHAVHNTAQNAYSGLAGQYHLHDDDERRLLPQGEFDVPLTVTDAMFSRNGKLSYDDKTQSGLWGDVILVNGKPWPVMKVKRRIYRFRVLNASISRSYRFSLSNGAPVTMVATDGGLMPVAQTVTSWRHAGAERYEVLIDFSKYAPGTRIELRNASNKNNIDFDFTGKVMAFDVTADPVDLSDPKATKLPTTLVPSTAMSLKPSDAVKTRRFRLKRDNNIWTIDGITWGDVIASEYQKVIADPDYDAVEIWEFENSSGGWYHPLHIHLVDFQILSRNGNPPFAWEKGPKDVVYVGEGETVRLIMRFEHQKGRYMVHCHNLPHEDHDMMAQFSVGYKAGDYDANDPIKADPAKYD